MNSAIYGVAGARKNSSQPRTRGRTPHPRFRPRPLHQPVFALVLSRNTTLGSLPRRARLVRELGNAFRAAAGNRATRRDQTDMPYARHAIDFEGPLTLAAKAERSPCRRSHSPPLAERVFDDAADQLHRYQRKFVFPKIAANDPPAGQFNSWIRSRAR